MKSFGVTIQIKNLFGSTFSWCHSFFNNLEKEIWDFSRILIFDTLGRKRVKRDLTDTGKGPTTSLTILYNFIALHSSPSHIHTW